jgi:hypothetical protein
MEGGRVVSEKGLKLLAVTVGVLCLVWVAVNFLPRGGGGGRASSGALSGFFLGVTPESVTSVRFQAPGDEGDVELTRTAGRWTVNSFSADSGSVARFWEGMADATVGDRVGSNPANHPRLGVSSDSAWTLQVETSEGTRSVLVGKSGSRYGTAYIRLPDENDVYLLEAGLRPLITRTLDDWRDKRVARVDTAAVQRIELNREGSNVVLERADTLWVLEDGGEADGTTVRSLLGEMARMDATGFYAPQDSLSSLGGSVRALDTAGDTLFFLEVGSGEGDRWARVEGDSIVYRIPSWRVSRILPEVAGLRGEG